MSRNRFSTVLKMIVALAIFFTGSIPATAKEIIHDAEHYVLLKQHKAQWAQQDAEIQKKLDALREKHGKPPNIIHIMWDDTPVGEIGIPAIQKVRGWETPVMNEIAAEGINFMRMYTEPSCTPSRAAVMTGRHAVRNGMYNVGFPYEYGGLAADEVTIAEVLSKAGYATAFNGKSHLGDVESSYLTRQGFDEALWSPYNQVPSLYVPKAQIAMLASAVMYPDMYPHDPYDIDKGWRPDGYVWALEGTKGGPVREYGTPPNHDDYVQIEDEFFKRSMDFIDRSAKSDKPFFLALWPQVTSFLGFPDRVTVSGTFLQEGLARMDVRIGLIKQQLEDLGIADNTLVVLMADNGPMTHNGPPGFVETLYTGGKGDYTEGGVRVPAIAWWPGVIEPGQIVGDIIHETDLFTTFATLGGATKHIPRDRIIDGVNQTALFLKGDSYSRRDYVNIYTGPILAATVKGRYKKHWAGAKPGLSGPEFYDLFSDPREASGKLLPMFPAKSMFNQMRTRHQLMVKKYPNKGQNRDYPFQNIENARPETIKASQPRVDAKDVPFDPRDVIRQVPEWENTDVDWGIGGN
jgi:arylsulfatase A-like enzyme